MNKKKILSLLSAIVLLVEGIGITKAKGEGSINLTPPPSTENPKEDNASKTIILGEETDTIILKIDNKQQAMIVKTRIGLESFYDERIEKYVNVESFIYYDIETDERICAIPKPEYKKDYFDASKKYFSDGEVVEFLTSTSTIDFIKLFDNYEELKTRIEKPQTLEEVAETKNMMADKMRMMNIEWYSNVKTEHVFSGMVPLDRKGELVPSSDATFAVIEINDKICILFLQGYQISKKQKMLKEMFRGIDFSDGYLEKFNSIFLKIFGVKKIKNIQNIFLNQIGAYPLPGLAELTSELRKAEVEKDGRLYYDIEKLAYVYDMLPEEYKIDYEKLPKSSSIMEQRSIGSNKVYITSRDRFLLYGLTPDGRVYLDELPIGKEKVRKRS